MKKNSVESFDRSGPKFFDTGEEIAHAQYTVTTWKIARIMHVR